MCQLISAQHHTTPVLRQGWRPKDAPRVAQLARGVSLVRLALEHVGWAVQPAQGAENSCPISQLLLGPELPPMAAVAGNVGAGSGLAAPRDVNGVWARKPQGALMEKAGPPPGHLSPECLQHHSAPAVDGSGSSSPCTWCLRGQWSSPLARGHICRAPYVFRPITMVSRREQLLKPPSVQSKGRATPGAEVL